MLKSKICADLKSKICVDLIVKSSFIDSVKRARIWQKNGLFIEGTKEGIITNTGELQLDCKIFSVFRQQLLAPA